jgi:hypothetical protein
MLMRYLWGLAVGHVYAHQRKHLVRDDDSEQEESEDQGVEHTYNQRAYDGGCARDQRVCDEEYGQYRSDSDSVSDSTDYWDQSDDLD